jgi:hypothetical protein
MNRLVCACLGIALFAVPAEAYQFSYTPDGQPVRWAKRVLRFSIDASPPGGGLSWDEAAGVVREAFAAWESMPGAPIRFEELPPYAAADDAPPPVGLDVLVLWRSGGLEDEDRLAETEPLFDPQSGRLVWTEILVDVAAHRYRPGAGFVYDLQSSVTHEVGHLLGLEHSRHSGSTMYAGLAAGDRSKRTLSADDVDGVRVLYGEAPLGGSSLEAAQDVGDRVQATACQAGPEGGDAGPLALLLAAVGVARRGRSSRRRDVP